MLSVVWYIYVPFYKFKSMDEETGKKVMFILGVNSHYYASLFDYLKKN